jgi:hypothetical protein
MPAVKDPDPFFLPQLSIAPYRPQGDCFPGGLHFQGIAWPGEALRAMTLESPRDQPCRL